MEETYLTDTPRLRMQLGEDLTTATQMQFYIRHPDGSEVIKTCAVESLATGIVYYDIVDGDLPTIGIYRLQCKVTFAGQRFKSKTIRFKVLEDYE